MLTQKQLARKLGVSRQLVTLALAGYPHVAEQTRQRIVAAAQKWGYRANPHARALNNARTGIISLWIRDQNSTHNVNVARELGRLVKQAGQELIISELGANFEATKALSHLPVDGRIVVDLPDRVAMYGRSPRAQAVPVVSMGVYCSEKTDFVKVDLSAGTKEAMDHLIGSGYCRIAHAFSVRVTKSTDIRFQGYLEAMRQAKLRPEFISYPIADPMRPSIRQAIQDYIRTQGAPEAIFCHSDDAAIAIYRGLCDLKLRVPHDVALVGCDGIPDTEYLEPALTTIVQPIGQMCLTAWQFLMRRLACPDAEPQEQRLKSFLAIRPSSARARPA